MYKANNEVSTNLFYYAIQSANSLYGALTMSASGEWVKNDEYNRLKLGFQIDSIRKESKNHKKSVSIVDIAVSKAQNWNIPKAEKLFHKAYAKCPLNIVALGNLIEACMDIKKFILVLQYTEILMRYISFFRNIPVKKPERNFVNDYWLYVYTTRGECFL